jgi:hypothetical protein
VAEEIARVLEVPRGQGGMPMPGGGFAVVMSDLQIDWARSPQLDVDVPPGEVISLECAPGNVRPFGPGAADYIALRRTA